MELVCNTTLVKFVDLRLNKRKLFADISVEFVNVLKVVLLQSRRRSLDMRLSGVLYASLGRKFV